MASMIDTPSIPKMGGGATAAGAVGALPLFPGRDGEITPFQLERWFDRYEFTARHLACLSDSETRSVAELLALEPGSLERLLASRLGYTESKGTLSLRRTIATHMYRPPYGQILDAGDLAATHKVEGSATTNEGVSVTGGADTVPTDDRIRTDGGVITEEDVLVHVGAGEAIHNFMAAVLRPGDHLVVQWPSYQSCISVAEFRGCQVSKWKMHPPGPLGRSARTGASCCAGDAIRGVGGKEGASETGTAPNIHQGAIHDAIDVTSSKVTSSVDAGVNGASNRQHKAAASSTPTAATVTKSGCSPSSDLPSPGRQQNDDDFRPDWWLDVDELASMVRPGSTRAIYLNSPHNPTGYTMPADTLMRVVEVAKRHDLLLFVDEVYRKDSEPVPPACMLWENAISLNVLSKPFGMPGLRVGWVATRNRQVIQSLHRYKDFTSICTPGMTELLAEVGIRQAATILRRNRELAAANRAAFLSFLHRHPDCFDASSLAHENHTNLAFVRLMPRLLTADGSATAFCTDAAESKYSVLLLPGACVCPEYADFVRFGFGQATFVTALGELEKFLADSKDKDWSKVAS